MQEIKNLNSITEAAKIIGVDRSTVHRYITAGLLKKEIVGLSPKITKQELERFIKLHKE